jgi:hypothetical protein
MYLLYRVISAMVSAASGFVRAYTAISAYVRSSQQQICSYPVALFVLTLTLCLKMGVKP